METGNLFLVSPDCRLSLFHLLTNKIFCYRKPINESRFASHQTTQQHAPDSPSKALTPKRTEQHDSPIDSGLRSTSYPWRSARTRGSDEKARGRHRGRRSSKESNRRTVSLRPRSPTSWRTTGRYARKRSWLWSFSRVMYDYRLRPIASLCSPSTNR